MLLPVRPLGIGNEDAQVERPWLPAVEAPSGGARFLQNGKCAEWPKETIIAHRAEPATKTPRPTGVLAEARALHHHRQARFHHFDRYVLHRAHRNVLRGVDTVAVDARAPADASVGLMPDLAAGIGLLAVKARIAEIAAGARPHFLWYGLGERLVDRLDSAYSGPDREDRRRVRSVEQVAFGGNHLERPELPAIRGLVRRSQALEADARGGSRHAETEIDRPVHHLARTRIIDRHFVTFDGDAHMYAHEVVIDPVIVHPVLGLPFAVRHGAYGSTRLLFASHQNA